MNDLLYIKHPFLSEIKANIVKREYDEYFTRLILDRTIFYENTSHLLDEDFMISSKKIVKTELKNDDLVHTIKGRPDKSKIVLSLNKDKRIRNLYYNTAFYLFKAIFYKFYNIEKLDLDIYENKARLRVFEVYEDIDIKSFKELFKKIIRLGFDINKTKDKVFIDGFSEFKSEGSYLNNSKYLEGFFINSFQKFKNSLLIEFIVGDDYLNFVDSNISLIEDIKNIAIGELQAHDKIRKIIANLQKNK